MDWTSCTSEGRQVRSAGQEGGGRRCLQPCVGRASVDVTVAGHIHRYFHIDLHVHGRRLSVTRPAHKMFAFVSS